MILSGIKGVYYSPCWSALLNCILCHVCYCVIHVCIQFDLDLWGHSQGIFLQYFVLLFIFLNFHRYFCSFKLRFLENYCYGFRNEIIVNFKSCNYISKITCTLYTKMCLLLVMVVSSPFHGDICYRLRSLKHDNFMIQ